MGFSSEREGERRGKKQEGGSLCDVIGCFLISYFLIIFYDLSESAISVWDQIVSVEGSFRRC